MTRRALERRFQVSCTAVKLGDQVRPGDAPAVWHGVAELPQLLQRGGQRHGRSVITHIQHGLLEARSMTRADRRRSRRPGSVAWIDGRRYCRAARPGRRRTSTSAGEQQSRISGSRPDTAALKSWMMSPICPSPPSLATVESEDSVRSVEPGRSTSRSAEWWHRVAVGRSAVVRVADEHPESACDPNRLVC